MRRAGYVSSAFVRVQRDSSRHSLSAFSHSTPPIGNVQSDQLSSGFGDPGCAAIGKTAQADHIVNDVARFAASGYGDWGRPSATTWPPRVLISTESIQSTPERYCGGSGFLVRIAVIGEHDEVETSTGRGRCDLVGRAGPVRSDWYECGWRP